MSSTKIVGYMLSTDEIICLDCAKTIEDMNIMMHFFDEPDNDYTKCERCGKLLRSK